MLKQDQRESNKWKPERHMDYLAEVELDPLPLLLLYQQGKSLRSKVKAMWGKRLGSCKVSQCPRETHKEKPWHSSSDLPLVLSFSQPHSRLFLSFSQNFHFLHCPPLLFLAPSLPPWLVCLSLASAGVKLPLCLFCFVFPMSSSSSSLTPISGCCESEGAIKRETQSSQP